MSENPIPQSQPRWAVALIVAGIIAIAALFLALAGAGPLAGVLLLLAFIVALFAGVSAFLTRR